jgi:hypothetical protein
VPDARRPSSLPMSPGITAPGYGRGPVAAARPPPRGPFSPAVSAATARGPATWRVSDTRFLVWMAPSLLLFPPRRTVDANGRAAPSSTGVGYAEYVAIKPVLQARETGRWRTSAWFGAAKCGYETCPITGPCPYFPVPQPPVTHPPTIWRCVRSVEDAGGRPGQLADHADHLGRVERLGQVGVHADLAAP